MDLLPGALSLEDVVEGKLHRLKQYLDARGDPSITFSFRVTQLRPPPGTTVTNSAQINDDDEDDENKGDENEIRWFFGLNEDVCAAVKGVDIVTEASCLQVACLTEQRHMVAMLFDKNYGKRVSTAPPVSSVLPSSLYLAVMYKQRDRLLGPSFGSQSLAETLLLRGVDPNGLHEEQLVPGQTAPPPLPVVTPLHLAFIHDNFRIATSLLQAGAVVEHEMRGLLLAACMSCSLRCFLLLRRRREALTDLMLREPIDSMGRTCLHIAAMAHLSPEDLADATSSGELLERRVSFAQLLIGLGCPVDATDTDGNTALHLAWMLGRGAFARFLAEDAGASVVIPNRKRQFPFECHRIPLCSASLVLYGGAHGIIQDRGPLSPLAFFAYLSINVFPKYPAASNTSQKSEQCHRTSREESAERASCAAVEQFSHRFLSTSPTDGMTALHVLCSDESRWVTNSEESVIETLCLLLDVCKSVVCGGDALQVQRFVNLPTALHGQRTALQLALLSRAPSRFVTALVEFGANPLIVCGPLDRRRNAFQLLCEVERPVRGVSDIAFALVRALPAGVPFESVPTHPQETSSTTGKQASMFDVPTVASHPYWQPFAEFYRPPHSEVERRSREAERFRMFAEGAVDAIVGQIDVVPQLPLAQESNSPAAHTALDAAGDLRRVPQPTRDFTIGLDIRNSCVPTPLRRYPDVTSDDDQGAYMVLVQPVARHPSSTTAPSTVVAKEAIADKTGTTAFAKKVEWMLDQYANNELPERNFYHELVDDSAHGGAEAATERTSTPPPPPADLSRWIDSLSESSVLQSTIIAKAASWLSDLRHRSSGEQTLEYIMDRQQTLRLACKKQQQLSRDAETMLQRVVRRVQ